MEQLTIPVEKLRDWLERGQPVTVLDVRPASEREEWAIPGSLHIDAYDALWAGDKNALAGANLAEADAPVVTVCAAGKTSLIAANQLRDRGLKAYSLEGGMKAWSLAWNTAEVPLPGSSARIVQLRRTGKGCLSYVIGSGDEAAVIDASLEPQTYTRIADAHGWKITHVLDTHIHADHLSRSRTLANLTGARFMLPAQDRASFAFTPVRDGTLLHIGNATVRTLHTPGHTLESVCYLLDDKALFTGDTLFLSSIGRPDLEASAGEARERASALYRSLYRLFALHSAILVLPGHTSEPAPFDGEAIAAPLSDIRQHLGMLNLPEDDFVEAVLSRIPATPPNHHRIVELNEGGVLPEGDLTDLEAGANRCAIS